MLMMQQENINTDSDKNCNQIWYFKTYTIFYNIFTTSS